MQDLRITLVQADIRWQNPDENRLRYAEMLVSLRGQSDLVLLPEMFTTGFSMAAVDLAEKMDGPSVAWLAEQAAALQAATCASLIVEENGHYYNRLVFMRPDGTYETYDKRHLFAMAGEHEHYTAGRERLIVDYLGWRICPMICYDLRFPVWSRNDDAFDLLIYLANWPDRRSYDWRTLLRARAIENQCYVAAVNRVGTDDNDHHYQGDSCLLDPGWRKALVEMSQTEGVYTATLSADHLRAVRKKLPFLTDRDQFAIHA